MYGPYGSFAPSYDSSRATITKEQSDLLYSTYGDDTGIHYAKRWVEETPLTFAEPSKERSIEIALYFKKKKNKMYNKQKCHQELFSKIERTLLIRDYY